MAKRSTATPVKSYAPNGNGAGPAVEVQIDKLTWDDLYLVVSIDKDAPFTPQLVGDIRALFNRVIVGGAAAVPVIHTQAVLEQIGAAMAEMGNPKNSASA